MADTVAARISLARAQEALAALREHNNNFWSDHASSFRNAWSDLLIHGGRVFTKIEISSKSVKGNFFGSIRAQRKVDPLLAYFWHARNADEHGLTPVIEHNSSNMKITVQAGKPVDLRPSISDLGIITYTSHTPWASVEANEPARITLKSVSDRGVLYTVPTKHMEKILQPIEPVNLASVYVKFLEGLVHDFERYVRNNQTASN